MAMPYILSDGQSLSTANRNARGQSSQGDAPLKNTTPEMRGSYLPMRVVLTSLKAVGDYFELYYSTASGITKDHKSKT